jgi:predicted acylesterase/phospholipase RssA
MPPGTQSDPAGPALEVGHWLSVDDLIRELAAARAPRVALSISGGGASGAYQAGVLRGYYEAIERLTATLGESARQATPRVIIGTSAGALNAYGLLLQHLTSEHGDRPGPFTPEPFLTALWRTIGSRDDGARFVTGRRAILVAALTRWAKVAWLRHAVTVVLLAGVAFLLNPVLFGVFLTTRPESWLVTAGRWIVDNPVRVTIAAAVALVAAVLWLVWKFGRSIFSNVALLDVLTAAARAGLEGRVPTRAELLAGHDPFQHQQAAMGVARAWRAKPRAPDFILTATDVTGFCEALFTLTHQATFARLAARGWMVSEIGGQGRAAPGSGAERCATVADSKLLHCIVASTSIPGVFPSQRIRLSPVTGGPDAVHDFVDGGVLNNSPMNVAVDAGATHVISIELDPLVAGSPLGVQARGGEPNLPANVAATFATLLNMATSEDIYRTVALNKLIRKQVVAADRAASRTTSRAVLLESELHGKKVIEIFRLAPTIRELGTLEFDGHYDHAWSAPSPSLVAWLDQGTSDVQRVPVDQPPPFWRATFQAYP